MRHHVHSVKTTVAETNQNHNRNGSNIDAEWSGPESTTEYDVVASSSTVNMSTMAVDQTTTERPEAPRDPELRKLTQTRKPPDQYEPLPQQ